MGDLLLWDLGQHKSFLIGLPIRLSSLTNMERNSWAFCADVPQGPSSEE